MSAASTKRVDRTGWPAGVWDAEPDHLEFEHAGFPCVLDRNPKIGAWWGWVFLDRAHPFYGEPAAAFSAIEVHGGVNVAAEVDGRWMVSFDCAHVWDLAPAMLAFEIAQNLRPLASEYETYRPMAYAKHQVQRLAEQLRVLKEEVS